jgi:hypothetical protein
MEEPGFLHIFLIWLIPASIELSIAYFVVRVVRDAERRSYGDRESSHP